MARKTIEQPSGQRHKNKFKDHVEPNGKHYKTLAEKREQNAIMREMVNEGKSKWEIAETLRLPYDTVRARLKRLNLVADRQEIKMNYRKEVADMKPIDAVEYLLQILEEFQPEKNVGEDMPTELVQLPNSELRLVQTMLNNFGKLCTKDMLYNALYWDVANSDKLPHPKIIDVLVCKIRRKLDPYGYVIITAWGKGYMMTEKPDS